MANLATGTNPGPTRPSLPLFVAGDVLHLILMPTEKCNFRCVYCYEDFEHGRMRRSVVEGVRKLISRRAPRLRRLTLDWFGGEPLLELAIVEEIQGHASRLAFEHPDLRLGAGMTTNGYLLGRGVLGRLVGLGLTSFQISVDGAATSHDARRKRGDGVGTFDRIWSNLLAARDSDLAFDIRLRIHVDRDNRAALPGFLEQLARELGDDERFEVYLRPVSRLGSPNDAVLPVLESADAAVVEELRRRAAELGLRIPAPGGLDACYAAAANSFVIRSTGEISKCTVAFHHPNNRVGRLHADGTATLDNGKINGWVRGLFSGEEQELRCPMKGFADRTDSTVSL